MSHSSKQHSHKRERSSVSTPTTQQSSSSSSNSHTAFRFTLWTSLGISLLYALLDFSLPQLLSPLYGLVLSSTPTIHLTSLGCFIAGYTSLSFSSLFSSFSSSSSSSSHFSNNGSTPTNTKTHPKQTPTQLTSHVSISYILKKLQFVFFLLLLSPWSFDFLATLCVFISQLPLLPSFLELETFFLSTTFIKKEVVRSPVWHPYFIHAFAGFFMISFVLGQCLASCSVPLSSQFQFLSFLPGMIFMTMYATASTWLPFSLSWVGQVGFGWITMDSVFLYSFLIPFTCVLSVGLSVMYLACYASPSSRSMKVVLSWIIWMSFMGSLTWYGLRTSRHLQPILNEQPISLPSNYVLLEKIGTHQVLHDLKRNILFLRAHHSLIGGIYRHTNDSIFSVFYYHDMHRLLHSVQTQLQVLMIGYGVGIAAETFVTHQHTVTAIEVEPAVVHLNKYFPYFVTPLIQDGANFVLHASNESYHVIVHDVFTGGQLPPNLFSLHHFQQLHRILKFNGTLSVNYVGQVNDAAFQYVHQLLLTLFSNVRCFSESKTHTFTNHVFFAMKKDMDSSFNEPGNGKAKTMELSFRTLSEKDFLGSEIRWFALSGFFQHEVELPPPFPSSSSSSSSFSNASSVMDSNINEKQKRLEILKTTLPNPQNSMAMAIKHWEIMRELIPFEVWKEY